MKKFKFTISGNNYEVHIQNIEDNVAEIEVNGTPYQVEIQSEVKTTKTPRLTRPNVVPSAEAAKPKTSSPAEGKGAGYIKAPLPGTVLEMKVKVGDVVKAEDTLLIMEAMKMENNIKADRGGKIVEVKVANGDSVLEGDILVEIGE